MYVQCSPVSAESTEVFMEPQVRKATSTLEAAFKVRSTPLQLIYLSTCVKDAKSKHGVACRRSAQ